ncbi:9363_t:CDS:1, partial [Scutellospora calospora]
QETKARKEIMIRLRLRREKEIMIEREENYDREIVKFING